jgi:anti-anti-sigma factor
MFGIEPKMTTGQVYLLEPRTDDIRRMNPRPFEIRVDAEGVLWLSGELDLEVVGVLAEVGAQHLDGQRSVVLDCSRLTFVDSSGILAILRLASEIPECLVLRNPRPNVRGVLAVAGIDETVGVRIEPSSEPRNPLGR